MSVDLHVHIGSCGGETVVGHDERQQQPSQNEPAWDGPTLTTLRVPHARTGNLLGGLRGRNNISHQSQIHTHWQR